MNSQTIFKKLLPHFLILLGFVLAAVLYNYPMMSGKKLSQNDITQSIGSAKEAKDYYEAKGELTLWTNSMFSGMPSFMIFMKYTDSITILVGQFISRMIPQPANFIFLYLAGFYLMMVMLGYHPMLAVFGAIGYAFASYNIISIEAGHINKVLALAYAPPFIGAVIMTYQGKYLTGGVLAAIFAGIELTANHFQITYYVIIALILYTIYYLIQIFVSKTAVSQKLKSFGIATAVLGLAAAISVGTHAALIWTTYEYTKETNRGGTSELSSTKKSGGSGLAKDYAFQWSYGIYESFSFAIPNFLGGGSGTAASLDENSNTYKVFVNNNLNPDYAKSMPIYWGAQPGTAGPAYVGAIICFLFVFGLLYSKDPIKWWLLVVSVLFVMFSWGKNFSGFNYFIFDYVPLYNKFRAITMILSVVQLFMVWMAVLGLQELLKPKADKLEALKYLKYSAGIVGGLVLIIALLGSGFQNFQSMATVEMNDPQGKKIEKNADEAFRDQITQALQNNELVANSILRAVEDDRAALQRADAWRSFIFIILAAGLLWLYLIDKLAINYALGGIVFLSLIDLWALDRRYLNEDNFVKKSNYEDPFQKTPADESILTDKDPHFRVFNQTAGLFSDGVTSYHHHSIGGYHAAKLQRYNELSEEHLFKGNRAVYNMLNTKYFIVNNQGSLVAQRNPEAAGNAWFVQEIKWVKNADAELQALNGFDPKKTAVIDQRYKKQLGDFKIKTDKKASIRLTSYAPNVLVYESNTSSPQLAVFSEIYYVNPGKMEWTAYLDGKEVPHIRVDYILRAMQVPAGKHKIEFKFDSKVYRLGSKISLISSIILVLGVIAALYFAWRKN
ncbi:MAG: hypothetical protein NW226_01460 [Microscillaceae bacterium]|nr:hypothetical protein [Microscillaceae bacterium]